MMASTLQGAPFTTRWFESLSNNAKERMPWVVQSLKGGVSRLYYRAATKEEANKMAHNLRDHTGKQPHVHAIRVVNEKTGEAGVSLPELKKEREAREPKQEENNVKKG